VNRKAPAGVLLFRTAMDALAAGYSKTLVSGQTTQAIAAADPISGHVLKIDVTLNVLK
jgi:hypothetical protein